MTATTSPDAPPAKPPQRFRRWSWFVAFLMAAAVGLNAWCYRHVWTMTHYSRGGEQTRRPEQLAGWAKLQVLLTGVNVPRPEIKQRPDELGLESTVHTLSTSDGAALEVWNVAHPAPRGRVCLFHGYGNCKSDMLHEARAFFEMGLSVVLVDFRGSGGSSGDTTTLGVLEARDVAAACRFADELEPPLPLLLYGRSMGSVAILRSVAHEGVMPQGLILECPFDRLLGAIRRRFTTMRLPSFPCAELMLIWGGVQHGIDGFEHDAVADASRVGCPTMILRGENDPRVSAADVQAIFDALTVERDLETISGVGHESCCRSNPEEWKAGVEPYVDRLLDSQP
ncbi:MAG: alpha/beta hydrolase [Planctomycetales bacterium]